MKNQTNAPSWLQQDRLMGAVSFVAGEDRHAADLAALCDIASHGLNARLWQKAIDEGKSDSLFEIGRGMMQVRNHDLSLEHATLAVANNSVIGAVLGLVRPKDFGDSVDVDRDGPELRGLLELQAQTQSSWHLSVLAVFREYQGFGFGRALMKEAAKRARAAKQRKMTLIVAQSNTNAVRLYKKSGFNIADQRHGVLPTPGLRTPNRSDAGGAKTAETWLLMRRMLLR